MITNTSSAQYQLVYSDRIIVRDDGLLVDADGYIGVALGSVYGPIGTRYTIETDSGNIFKVIKVDAKSDNDTTGGCIDANSAIMEFVIDMDKVSLYYPDVMRDGDFNSASEFNGTIIRMVKEE